MNGHQCGLSANKRVVRAFRLTATTRAIRAALFGSAALLALVGAAAADVGACTTMAPNSIACNGEFSDTVPGLYDPMADLTLVLGDSAPTSVIPGSGAEAVSISSQANVNIVTHADITTVGANGVHIDGAISATLHNDGTISTDVTLEGASTINISAVGDLTIVNGGALHAFSTGDYLGATAVTATATSALGNVMVHNLAGGTISADTTGYASAAVGISVTTLGGSAVVSNEGSISATATSNAGFYADYNFTYDNSRATGILVHSEGDATIVNSGSVSASSQNLSLFSGPTAGIAAYSYNGAGDILVTNAETGTVSVTAGLNAFGAIAVGGSNYFDLGTTGTVVNAGSISAEALGMGTFTGYAPFAAALAVGVFAAHTVNSGEITATSNGDFGLARGVWGSGSIDNSGTIFADSSDGSGTAQGVFVSSFGDASINNSGSIIATGSGSAVGVAATAIYGSVQVDNSGTIATVAVPGVSLFNATGIGAVANGGSVAVVNSGDVTLDCGNVCYGIYTGSIGGNTVIDNSGAITLTGRYYQQGVTALELGGAVTLTNSGSISVDSSAGVAGVGGVRVVNLDNITYYGENVSLDDQTTTITNTGSISAVINAMAGAEYLPVLGQVARAISVYSQSGAIVIDNSGSLTADSYSYSALAGGAVGISASSSAGDITTTNSGSIWASSETSSVYGGGATVGIFSFSDQGDVATTNSGTINAISISNYASDEGQTYAVGVTGISTHGDVTIGNGATGVITAEASTLIYNTAAAYGLFASTTAGNVTVTNEGSIDAAVVSESTSYLSSYGQTTAIGIEAINLFGDTTAITNSGSVSATAVTTAYGAANAFGIRAYASSPYATVAITNAGAINTSAHADGHTDVHATATATGLWLVNRYGGTSTVDNNGTIIADASSYLSSRASGVEIDASSLTFSSSGEVVATASADALAGTALATGLMATGGTLHVVLGSASALTATASAYDGTSIGLLVAGETVTASNAGEIEATFSGGPEGRSYGVVVLGNGDVEFANSGSITATSSGFSVGVVMSSDTATTLTNNGTISGGTAVLTGDSTDLISNSGTITGAIFTNDGNDTLHNAVAGLWRAIGSSNFGSGDDTISNAGTIVLNNSAISLGDSGAFGNAFINSGTIASFGDSVIDMGLLNGNAFINAGIIEFRDGMTDDMLTILGDFGGSGAINLDVSGLRGTSDQLNIEGSVLSGSVSTLNINLLDLPNSLREQIDMISVSGDSVASNFVLGDVHFNQEMNFLTLDFDLGLVSDIDTSNARADVFSLGFEVTGLSDTGSLGASIAPGAQSLVSSQVGTWRQRMGVIDRVAKGGLSLWTRFFRDKGSVNPEHSADNFGQGGNFAFDQKNSGVEIGADFGLNDSFSAGVLLGKVKADQDLIDGIGHSRIKGDSYGLYGTWLPGNGFYLDASYRTMDFDVTLNTLGGGVRGGGHASAFNVETGYAWMLGGMLVEPQFQYTRATVDDVDALNGVLADFEAKGGASSRARLGMMVRKNYGEGETVWTPYLGLSAVHEFDGSNSFSINDDFTGRTNVEGTSALVEAGVAVHSGNLSAFGGLKWQDGGALNSFVGAQIGVRYTW